MGTVVLGICALIGAYLDVTLRRLPNWLSVSTGLAGFGFVFAEFGKAQLPWAAGHAAIALLVGMALFRMGWIGGGDAKFYAACAAWFPLQDGLTLLILVSLAGLLLVFGWFGYRQFRRDRDNPEKGKFGMVPYGLAVAVGAIMTRVVA